MQKLAANFLQVIGIVLVLLGIVHLISTPHIPALLDGINSRSAYLQALGPTMLNHVLTGVFLIPLGYTTWLASAPRNASQSWARRVLLVNSVAVLAMPIVIVIFMRDPRYYSASLFVTGVSLVAVISVLMVAAVLLISRSGTDNASVLRRP